MIERITIRLDAQTAAALTKLTSDTTMSQAIRAAILEAAKLTEQGDE